jgi:uncharacterized protein (DUF1800 family)
MERRLAFAHVLRRTTFGPFPGQVDEAIERYDAVGDLIEAQLAAAPLAFEPVLPDPSLPDGGRVDPLRPPPDSDLRYYCSFRRWWPLRLMSDAAGVHDRMVWFWHTHFTSSFVKVDSTEMCWNQMAILDRNATGNFGDMVRELIPDRAMLRYLDGDGSKPAAPNENFARELMELFTLGVDQYQQSDVAAAARVLAGWYLDEHSQLHRDPTASPLAEPVSYLGTTVRSEDEIVDAILALPQCASFVVTKLWRYWIGGEPDPKLVTAWADAFRKSGYEIAPLVERILRSDAFLASHGRRARTAIEWYCAAVRAIDAPEPERQQLLDLGQSPYDPPTVAGWPGNDAWLSATHLQAKTRFLSTLTMPAAAPIAAASDPVAAVIERCSAFELTGPERKVLASTWSELDANPAVESGTAAAALLSAALLSPTFALA